jgi:hypothetical protein
LIGHNSRHIALQLNRLTSDHAVTGRPNDMCAGGAVIGERASEYRCHSLLKLLHGALPTNVTTQMRRFKEYVIFLMADSLERAESDREVPR